MNEAIIKQLIRKVNCLEKNQSPNNEPCVIKVATTEICVAWAEAIITDNGSPSFIYDKNSTSVVTTDGNGVNGNGREYVYTFPAHPNGANYVAKIQVWDDTQPDTGLPEIIAQTATSITYQIPQGDDGASPDDNDYYKHSVIVESAPLRVLTDLRASNCDVYIDGELVS